MIRRLIFAFVFCAMLSCRAEEQTGVYRVLGLCTPERQDVLRDVIKEQALFELVSIDFEKAEVSLRFDTKKLFPDMNPKKPPTADAIVHRLDERLRQASFGSFSLTAQSTVPKDKLQRVEIKIAIPDCKGCRLGTYNAIAKLEGVEQVNVSIAPSQITAWIDAAKTKRETLVEALKKARVGIPAE